MRIALITISILLNMAVLAQKPSKKPNKISFEQKIQIAYKHFKEGKTIEALQSYNIARILAGTDTAKHTVVDKHIETVFKAIEQQKEEAIQNEHNAKLAEATAKKSEQKAQIATNKANALYWTSEAEKINPIQGLRLIEKALAKTKDINIIKTVKQAKESVFNQSNNHQWRERRRFNQSVQKTFFSSENQWLTTKNTNNIHKIREVQNSEFTDILKEEKGIKKAFFSPDNRWLITKDEKNIHKIWDIKTGNVPEFLKKEKGIQEIIFSPDNQWLITKDENNTYKLWEIKTGNVLDFLKKEKGIQEVISSPDNQWLITKDENNIYKRWEMKTDVISNFIQYEGSNISMNFSPDGKWLVTNDNDNTAIIWSVEKKQKAEFLKAETNIHYATFSPNGKWLITINSDGTKVWSVEEKKIVITDLFKGKNNITHIDFSFDNKWLITKSSRNLSNTAQIYFVENWMQSNFLEDNIFEDIIFSPNSEWILTNQIMTSDRYNFYELWNVHHGKQPDFFGWRQGTTFFSPDSKWLVAIDESQNAKVWSLDNKEQPKFLEGEEYNDVVFSPNGQWLVELQLNKQRNRNYLAKVWSVESGKQANFLKEEKKIIEVTFSQDSKWLITRDVNQNYKVWSVESGKQANFLKEEKNISSVNFSKDSKLLSISTNHQVKTYEIATGKLIQTLWLNKEPTQAQIIDNRYLYVTVGKAIVKTDLQTQQGNLMSYGDGEELDYQYEEIQEWIKVFGDKYLLPLDEEIKKKYGID